MLDLNPSLSLQELEQDINHFWELSGKKIKHIADHYDDSKGSPVFTVEGAYSTRGWTEWTQGFMYGSALLQYDATGEDYFLNYGRENTLNKMAPHLTHIGVHDHGFNNISTYGNLLRLMREGKTHQNEWEQHFYKLALKVSGAVQATRWTSIPEGGFIHSFNGPHSLFVDTIRSVRILMLSHALGHVLQSEHDEKIDLLNRAIQHLEATAQYSIYYGEGRDSYDEWGRTTHEAIFNTKDGHFRCPNAQQGYTGNSTWTRGLAWAMCGFPEELEFFDAMDDLGIEPPANKNEIVNTLLKGAKATCDFYIKNTPTDGIPYWDTGAPNLHKLGDYLDRPSDPYNDYEPIDSSAAAIGAQGLLRLGKYLKKHGDEQAGEQYWQAGLQTVKSLLDKPYLSTDNNHQGLILHSIYHQPNGWDHVPEGSKIANGESSMWGDYHAREVVLYLTKLIKEESYYTFYNCL